MLGDLSEWDNYRRFHRDIGQLRQDQEQVAGETATLGRQTLSKDVKDLDAQQQADLAKLGPAAVGAGAAVRQNSRADGANGRLRCARAILWRPRPSPMRWIRLANRASRADCAKRDRTSSSNQIGQAAAAAIASRRGPEGPDGYAGQPPRDGALAAGEETPPGRAEAGRASRAARGLA